MNKSIALVFFLLLLLSLLTPVTATTVVGNSKDWHDLYLAAMYAHLNDYTFKYLESLGDAEIQTQLIHKDDPVIIVESTSKPVIKNYQSFLSVGGYESVTVITAADYRELQSQLFPDTRAAVLLDPCFGAEAIAAAPLLLARNATPFFLDAETRQDAARIPEIFIVGNYPLRVAQGLAGERLSGPTIANALTLALIVENETKSEWGNMGWADRFDPDALSSGLPMFLYAGDAAPVADAVRRSGITRFEVIGADFADIAKVIEGQSGKDLHLLLKYGQTITNFPGLEGKILKVRQISVPYPVAGLEVVGATYYAPLHTLVLRFRNPGTLPTLFFSNLEVGDLVFSDETMHVVLPGETVTIPYAVALDEAPETVTLTTRYGERPPLKKVLRSGDAPILRVPIEVSEQQGAIEVELGRVTYDGDKGELRLELTTPRSAIVDAEFFVGDDVLSAQPVTIQQSGTLTIPTPYLAPDALVGEIHNITLYYGANEIQYAKKIEAVVEKPRQTNTLILLGAAIVTFIIVLLIVWYKRRK